MEKKKKKGSIYKQVFNGYLITTLVTVAIVAVFYVFLTLINQAYREVTSSRGHQIQMTAAVTAHYEWLEELNASIQTGSEFTGSLDPETCSLGVWRASVSAEDLHDSTISNALDETTKPHKELHEIAAELLELRGTDRDAAYARYMEEIKPRVEQVLTNINTVGLRYQVFADAAAARLTSLIIAALVCSVLLAVAGASFSLVYANKIAKHISRPISAVADWSKKLSLGEENLDFDMSVTGKNKDNEIGVMIESFRNMAHSIQENVNVVRRVADGDMTAFVNIRSEQDSLGRNLYRMVQSNDMLFNEILQIAHKVAEGAGQIARASQNLAGTATGQAGAIQALSETIEVASQLIAKNAERTHAVSAISDRIQADARASRDKMDGLVREVEEIRTSSERISSVIKSIDDIAFQTNILALNASIEAARAGEAGKGFAVVADEVRDLALRSANAANESKSIIEDTIRKTHEGSKMSADTSVMFHHISEEIEEISKAIGEVAASTGEQSEGIDKVRSDIAQITEAASANAATSEESAAASREMSEDAAHLRKAMGRFHLRDRQRGHAYIPPEKANDEEFIRQANENYRRALETGRFGNAVIANGGQED